jgi:hypothetical protein
MKIRPVGAELFHTDGRTGRYYEAKSRFSHFANTPKIAQTCFLDIVVPPGESCDSNYALPK